MSLAQRVRDYRYSKGWGPDELAGRAAISRTALYQIESGKTELPRRGHAAADRDGAGRLDGDAARASRSRGPARGRRRRPPQAAAANRGAGGLGVVPRRGVADVGHGGPGRSASSKPRTGRGSASSTRQATTAR